MRASVPALMVTLVIAASIIGCKQHTPTDTQAIAPQQPEAAAPTLPPMPAGDSSRTSVDWPGTYKGTIPCANCPGIDVTLTLNEDGSYGRTTFYQGSDDQSETVRGRFAWDASGGKIALDSTGDNQVYRVGENRIVLLDSEGKPVKGALADLYVLSKSSE